MAGHRFYNKLSAFGFRMLINWWPPYWGAGVKVKKISSDFRHVEVILKSKWYNRNYVGTHFGGSIFSMTDPFYMLMLLKNLGSRYIVWDKSARIEFIKPGRGKLFAKFNYSAKDIAAIKQKADQKEKYIFDQFVDVRDEKGEIVASIVKTLYVRRKQKKI